MKIAYIIPSLENKGPNVFTKYLIDALVNSDKIEHVQVFYFNSMTEGVGDLKFSVPVKKISLLDKIDFDNYDVIHTTMLKPDLYAFINKRYVKNKLIVSMHNYFSIDLGMLYPKWRAALYTFLWKFVLKNTERIVVSSTDMLNYYSDFLNQKVKFEMITYGVSKRIFQTVDEAIELLSLKEKYKVLGSCGLLIKRKGFQQLIEFLVKNPDYAFILIGDGDERANLESLVKENQLADRFIFLGFKSNSIDYYQYFDLFIMCSYSEGFGLAMLEALSQGIPLVCSDLPIYNDFFNNKNVRLFKPGDENGFSSAILDSYNNKDILNKESLKLYDTYFSLDVMAQRHIRLYEKVITENKIK
jgi:glycosyltransferase involved in cell wall biosynthesis